MPTNLARTEHPDASIRQGVAMTAAITVRGLRKTYRDQAAVDGLDLDVALGEVVAMLGPNGAGKTTTVEILEGHRTRDGGTVEVLGRDPADADDAFRTRIGIVGQSQSDAFGELTVDEIVGHFGRFYPRPRDTGELVELVGLSDKRNSRLRQLSGGQRRRVDVALGVVGRPELLFLDEPTTGFDPEARRQFWSLVRLLADEGTTVLLTTHYLQEAEALADRVAVIVRGNIAADGPPATLGGRDRAGAIVEWLEGGATRREQTDQPTRTVTELAARFGGEVPGLSVSRPTLEDVYLQLIGEAS
jgi:ABC-2 type transport system ATP-binding protein